MYKFAYKITESFHKWLRQHFNKKDCPEIYWDKISQIRAMGHDTFGPFEISITFTYFDNTQTTIFVHHKCFDDVVQSLPIRFASISPSWYFDMISHPQWHVEQILYSCS